MPSAIAKVGDTVLAESDDTIFVEGNHYFPESDVKMDLLSSTDLSTVCHWKGDASYFSINAGSEKLENAAWTYLKPKTKQAEPLKDMVAFYGTMVEVSVKK